MADIRQKALNVADLRAAARRRLPRGVFAMIDRGCEDDVALTNNRAALARIKLLPRVLVDVSARRQDSTLFGKPLRAPLVIGPAGPTGQLWYRGELAMARAAAEAGIPFTLASPATEAMENIIANVPGGRHWFQLYMWRDHDISHRIMKRARDAGFEALVVTVDSIVPANREFAVRSGFSVPLRLSPRNLFDLVSHPRWLLGTMGQYWLRTGIPRYRNYPPDVSASMAARPLGRSIDKSEALSWDDLGRLRDLWPGALIVKGIMTAEDAASAVRVGADAVVVSNHGGIACDASVAPVDALPAVAAAVGGQAAVLIDSGFRRGADVVKALALGADAVLLGRAALYGLAAAGQAGAARTIEILKQDIDRTLAVLGCRSIGDITRAHVVLEHERIGEPSLLLDDRPGRPRPALVGQPEHRAAS